jgi:hypothetical protein
MALTRLGRHGSAASDHSDYDGVPPRFAAFEAGRKPRRGASVEDRGSFTEKDRSSVDSRGPRAGSAGKFFWS